jgi:hypothetical protein
MNAVEVARTIRPAIAALATLRVPPGSRTPQIIGTGVVVGDGLVLTNQHVVDRLEELPREGDPNKWPFRVLLNFEVEAGTIPGTTFGGNVTVPLEVLGIFAMGDFEIQPDAFHYGPRRPDFALVQVKAKGLPTVRFLDDVSGVQPGLDVLCMGYPMGDVALRAPGWQHQSCPTLQHGMVSAVLPFPCKAPDGFVLDMPTLGGSSGSPVVLATEPRAIGLLYAGLTNPQVAPVRLGDGSRADALVTTGTPFTYIISAHIISAAIRKIETDARIPLPQDTMTLAEILSARAYGVPKAPGVHEDPSPPHTLRGSDTIPLGRVVVDGGNKGTSSS